jgi:hypothetical protein
MTCLIACAVILVVLVATYLLARSDRRCGGDVVPPHRLPTELQRQEFDRLSYEHRVRTRAILDSALHSIQKVAGEHRNDR